MATWSKVKTTLCPFVRPTNLKVMETTFEIKSQSLVEKREHVGHCGNKNHT
jgi:hypothetical protein